VTPFLQHHHNFPWNHTLKGALEFTYPTFQEEFVKHSIERNVRIFLDLVNSGKLKIAPFYSHKMQPSEAQEAYDGLRENPEEFVGVIFDWT
jgi:threonine dehydrogenase-like Zn-dependent dehydrogenase